VELEQAEQQTQVEVAVGVEHSMAHKMVVLAAQVWSLLAIHLLTQSGVVLGLPLQPQLSELTRSQHSLLALAQ
jgi:hypothetical protein